MDELETLRKQNARLLEQAAALEEQIELLRARGARK